ncbi:MAG TPA: thioredoxin domain-containing protein [Kofleriaceae bacterium]|nr:thioredoxin domain-containing protein [Kofleriaceae bacterium]
MPRFSPYALVVAALISLSCQRTTAPPPPPADPAPAVTGSEDPALPGIATPSPRLAATLAAALAHKGPAYKPRTRHLLAGGAPRFTNRLILQTSPYLLQHAHNPVNWYAWGDEPFARARREGKLVMLSIGYSTCHWCHVMERESFEDEEVARFLNENFVCIKVDREERPDLDDTYMKAVQAIVGDGGWPMTVFLTAERQPFFAGTYFPRDRLLGTVQKIRELQKSDPNEITSNSARVMAALQHDAAWMRGDLPGRDTIAHAVRELGKRFDATWGGFGGAPKFPQPTTLDLLLRFHRRTGDAEALRMVTVTLEKMAAGGIHDQIGGGFHRYATDAEWHVPHFEKMLYDQAQLAAIYLDASQVTGRADFAATGRDVVDYLLRDMQAPDGGFYSATDADSPTPAGEDAEGAFFLWTRGELTSVLGPALAATAAAYYGVDDRPSILRVVKPAAEVARQLGVTPDQLAADVARARAALFTARAHRAPPHLDDKIVTAWNGLAISALARAATVLEPAVEHSAYVTAAQRAAHLLLAKLRDRDGRLARSLAGGVVGARGVLDDYACLITGLLDLYDADGDPRWIDDALALQRTLDRDFAAPDGGYFATASVGELQLARDKPSFDGAEPSGNALALANLLRLAEITGDDAWHKRAEAGFAAFSVLLARGGSAAPRMLGALEAFYDRPLEIALVAPGDPAELAPLLAAVRRAYLPNHVLARTVAGAPLDALARHLPWLEGKHPVGGKPTAFVCEHATCKLPTSDADALARQLRQAQPLP